MRRKVLGVLLTVCMTAGLLAGCAGNGGQTEASKTAETQATSEASETKSEAAESTEKAETTAAETTTGALPFTATELSEGKTFAVCTQTSANAFFLAEITGVEETLAQGGINATVLAPDSKNDISTQVENIQELCARGDVDAIIIDPLDLDGIKPALVECERAEIPVVIIDSSVADSDYVLTTIESDNKELGRLAAEALCEEIGGEGQIVVIHWDTLQCVRERVDGLEEVLAESYPNVEIAAVQNAYGVVEDAQSIMESFLQSYPDVKGVFAINSPTAQGAIAAIEAAGLGGQIPVVDIDGAQNDIDMIKEGKLLCSPVQYPKVIANKAIESLELFWDGKGDQIEKHIYINGSNITADNIAEFDGNTY